MISSHPSSSLLVTPSKHYLNHLLVKIKLEGDFPLINFNLLASEQAQTGLPESRLGRYPDCARCIQRRPVSCSLQAQPSLRGLNSHLIGLHSQLHAGRRQPRPPVARAVSLSPLSWRRLGDSRQPLSPNASCPGLLRALRRRRAQPGTLTPLSPFPAKPSTQTLYSHLT
jgi:hypothetical protein